MSIEKKPSRFMKGLLSNTIRLFINSRSNVMIERNDTRDMEPPYLILSNHVNNWDPLFLNCYVDEPCCFIAADPLFRHPLLKHVLNYTGAIRKMKFKNDVGTIRNVLKAKKHNRVIAIFPEGNRSWDGETEPLIYSTAKLAKLLDIPVVVATIRGGYLTHPRWANNHRKGTISISFENKWDKGAFKEDSTETVHQKLTDALYYNEVVWQFDKETAYNGKQLAHYLERLLFVCPHCKTPGQLHSHDDLLTCQSCDYTVRYTPAGTFEKTNQPVYYATPRDWNNWQLEFLEATVADTDWTAEWNAAMQDHVKLYMSAAENQPFKLLAAGNITWSSDSIYFQADNGEAFDFPFANVEGINIQFHHKLDFFIKNTMYRIIFYQPRTSAYKWLKVIESVQALDPNNDGEVEYE